ncbi:unnamed protein product [Vitrella brassicaformis CCMP3155]|uniref:Chalcone isomerase domain-containing protein n=2 Tax=Vitrella brassicaformis TaxID=1169539 RepID=A0A0G4GUV1_VITBC|nr:unnamed protein product [Vitrella brassicaformis CCMP3155]|eukprot:CEM34595.1 unnamed protein product [Vitrella brassicaformis CCMP3155]
MTPPVAAVLKDKVTGIEFPCEATFPGTPKMTLLGAGPRRKNLGIAKVNVYSVGLYVEPKEAAKALSSFKGESEESLMNDDRFYDTLLGKEVPKLVLLKFARTVGAHKVADALSAVKGVEPEVVSEFCSLLEKGMGASIKKAETIAMGWTEDQRLDVLIRGQPAGTVVDAKLPKAFFELYLGKTPVSMEAKHAFVKRVASLFSKEKAE